MTDSLPEKYWHCYLYRTTVTGRDSLAVRNDLTLADLHSRILEPYKENRLISMGGIMIPGAADVREILCFHTENPLSDVVEAFSAQQPLANLSGRAEADLRLLPIEVGRNYTSVLLGSNRAIGIEQQMLVRTCGQLVRAADALTDRGRGRDPYFVVDEYDAQDLLYGILRTSFDDVVKENPLPKVGGTSSRADLTIQSLGVIIEMKYARPGMQGALVTQFHDDCGHYAQWPHLEMFLYVIYNAGVLPDRNLLPLSLDGEYRIRGQRFLAKVVLNV